MASKKKSPKKSIRRRSKAESMTGAKEAEVEQRQLSANLSIASEDKILHHCKVVKGWDDKVETVKGHRRNALQAAKADHVSSETIKYLNSLERGDAVAFRTEMELRAAGLRAVGAPFQMTIFDTAYGSEIEQAKAEGRAAANAGRGFECRFPEGSEAHEAGMAEWMRINLKRAPGAESIGEDEISDAMAPASHTGKPLEMARH